MATEKTKTQQIVELHNDGLTTSEIAKKLGISYQHAYNVLQQKGLCTPQPKSGDTKTSKILRLHEEGKTTGEIKKELDITFQHVYNVLKSKGKIVSKK